MNFSNPPGWASTFLHEYVHFLQDITSTHGLLNFIHAIEHLRNANKQVTDDASADFSIPLILTNDFNWETNRKLKEIYRGRETPGRDRVKSICYLSYTASTEQIPAHGGASIVVPKYQIKYYDNGAHTEMTCHFGSIHIKEYMAHAVQKQFAPDTINDDLPYFLAELIVKKEVPKLAENPAFIIALCDASLMNYHSAQLFFQTIERMKTSDWTPTDIESVYAFTYKDLKPENCDSFDALFARTTEIVVDQFRDALKDDIYKDNVQWFEELIVKAKDLRLSQRGFFTKLVSSSGTVSPTFAQIINDLGIPFTTNAESKGYFIPPDKLKHLVIQPFYPKVFQAISKTFSGYSDCSLYPFCEAAGEENITNEDCKSKPWKRVNLPKLCPYAQMWRAWGLQGKNPQPSERQFN
jgi:hypothetical protein